MSTAGNYDCANFTIASDTRKDKDGNMGTNFYRVTAWRGLADTCMKFLHKGDRVFVTGDLELKSYVNKQGVKQYQMEVSATDIEFLSERRSDNPAPTKKQNQQPRHTNTTEDEDSLPF